MKVAAYILFGLAIIVLGIMARTLNADMQAGESSEVIMGTVLWMVAVPLVLVVIGVCCYRKNTTKA